MVQERGTLGSLSSGPFAQFFQETYEWVTHRRFCKHVLHSVVWQDSIGNKCVCKPNTLFSERTWLFFPIITDFEKRPWETRGLCKGSLGSRVWKQAAECCCVSITHSWGQWLRGPHPLEGIQQAAPDLVSSQSGGRGSHAGSTVNTAPATTPALVRVGDARGGEGRPRSYPSPAECSICGGRRFLAIDSGCQEENKNACSSLSRVHARCGHYQLILMPLSKQRAVWWVLERVYVCRSCEYSGSF